MPKWKVVGINFDHVHMGDLLRMAHSHPGVEVVGVSDLKVERMAEAARTFSIPGERVYVDYRRCLEECRPDLVILCPATARHGEWTERVAEYGVNVLVEKPFAASLAEADRMTAAVGLPTLRLVRYSIGPFTLDGIAPGHWRRESAMVRAQ